MAWTTPRTWVTGEVVTAAEMNSNIRDNLTLVVWKLFASTTPVDIVSSTTETDLFGTAGSGTSVPGGTLGTDRTITVKMHGYTVTNGSNPTGTMRMYYGGTLIGQQSATLNSNGAATKFPWAAELNLSARGSTSSQSLGGIAHMVSGASDVVFPVGSVTAISIDSTSAQNLRVTWQWGTSSSTVELQCDKVDCYVA